MGHKSPPANRRGNKPPPPPVESSSSEDDDMLEKDEEEEVCMSHDEANLPLPVAEAAQIQALLLFEQTDIAPKALAFYGQYRALLLEREALYAEHVAAKRDELVRQSVKRQRGASGAAAPSASAAFFTVLAKTWFRKVQQGFLMPVVEQLGEAWDDNAFLGPIFHNFPFFSIAVEDETLLAAVTNITRRYLCRPDAAKRGSKDLREQAVDGLEYTFHFGRQAIHSSPTARIQFFFAGSSFHRLGQVRFGRIIDVRVSRLALLPNASPLPEDSFFGFFFGSSAGSQLADADTDALAAVVGPHDSIRLVLQNTLFNPAVVERETHIAKFDAMMWAGTCQESESPTATGSGGKPPIALSVAPKTVKSLLTCIYGAKAVSSKVIVSNLIVLNAAIFPVCAGFLSRLSSVEDMDLDEADDDDEGDIQEEFDDRDDDDADEEEEEVAPPPRKQQKQAPKPPAPNDSAKKPECKQS